MRPVEQWIWLPEADYPQNQITRYSERVHKRTEKNYTVAAFSKAYCFPKAIEQVQLRFSGDTAFALFCNERHIANGPVLPGGDFLDIYANDPLPQHYASEVTLTAAQMPAFAEGRMAFYQGPFRQYCPCGGAALREVLLYGLQRRLSHRLRRQR